MSPQFIDYNSLIIERKDDFRLDPKLLDKLRELAKNMPPFRLRSVRPTDTVRMLGDVSDGVEPMYGWWWRRSFVTKPRASECITLAPYKLEVDQAELEPPDEWVKVFLNCDFPAGLDEP